MLYAKITNGEEFVAREDFSDGIMTGDRSA